MSFDGIVAQKTGEKICYFCATFYEKTIDFFIRLWYNIYVERGRKQLPMTESEKKKNENKRSKDFP